MTLARWLCAVACIAMLSACKGGDDDSGGAQAKDAGSQDRDASSSGGKSGGGKSGNGGNGGSSASGAGGKSGSNADSGDGGGDRDAATEMMSDAASEPGGQGGASGGAGGSSGTSSNENDPDKCGGATCPEPSVCDHNLDPPACVCPEGYHYVDVGGGAPPCEMDCAGADCDAGS